MAEINATRMLECSVNEVVETQEALEFQDSDLPDPDHKKKSEIMENYLDWLYLNSKS